jgi:ABC-2 type transport system permease protein
MSTETMRTETMSPETMGTGSMRTALASEWTKVRTARSTAWTPAVMVGLVIGLAAFVGATESLQPDDTVVGGSLTGAVIGQVAAGVFGVLVMSGEYGSGLIRATLAACPRRGTVLAAKAAVVAGTTFVLAVPALAAAYVAGDALLPDGVYARGEPFPAMLGVAACFAATGLLGLAAATALRSSAGAITAVVALLLMPSMFGPLLGDLQRWLGGASPLGALEKLTQTSDASAETVGSLGPWPSLAVVGAYSLVALAASGWLLRRRDA